MINRERENEKEYVGDVGERGRFNERKREREKEREIEIELE